ncbi:Phosphopantetheine adenylyltransferase [compost metagenome]
MKAIYPGSFDPFTNGHYDILRRAIKTYDEVTILLAVNPDKVGKLRLSVDERLDIITDIVRKLEIGFNKSVYIASTKGLVADYVNESKADVIVRGIRNYTDLAYELNIERFNQELCDAETVYFSTKRDYMDISSTAVWELAKWGKFDTIWKMVPTETFNMLKRHFKDKEGLM